MVNAPSVAPRTTRYETTHTVTVNDVDYTVITVETDWRDRTVITTVIDPETDRPVEFPVLRRFGETVDMYPVLSTTVPIRDYYLAGLIASAVAYANARWSHDYI